MIKSLSSAVALAVITVCSAHAQSISGSAIKADFDTPSFSSAFSVSAYSPWTTTPTLGLKSQDGYTGVGVQGATNGEIDWRNGLSESITLTFASATQIDSFTLGVLFNGPEYNDVMEVARITVNGGNTSYYLVAQATENLAKWYDGNTYLGDVSFIAGAGTQSGEGGAITVSNPFGNLLVTSLTFAAAQGQSGGLCSTGCNNQSDYSVVAVTPVPEPSTYALMLAGLGAVGFIARRRRHRV